MEDELVACRRALDDRCLDILQHAKAIKAFCSAADASAAGPAGVKAEGRGTSKRPSGEEMKEALRELQATMMELLRQKAELNHVLARDPLNEDEWRVPEDNFVSAIPVGNGSVAAFQQLLGGAGDDDIEVVNEVEKVICPLSLEPFVDPLKSKVCGHTFSRGALEKFIRQHAAKAAKGKRVDGPKCPQAGCNKPMQMSDFEEDVAMAAVMRVEQRKRDAEKQQEDEDCIDVDSD